eukprot:CAMPEP_0117426990 /NCGR_PEP_ID=MMETSP0758-20121206/6951_1 /TAXON_ID=63605 /ORGANISM="Percolomonas cosmopolitus, Strain AE-1 (ATCC 50343)" /LENGTH=338 /DNA_ID=CAMNT_0005212405 /DNA_START=464 /DNA_END=1477 /DNA_ORIENTATION=-
MGAKSITTTATVVTTWINGQGNKPIAEGLVDLLTNHHGCDVVVSALMTPELPMLLNANNIKFMTMHDFEFLGVQSNNLMPIGTKNEDILVDMIMFDIQNGGYTSSPLHHIPIGNAFYISIKSDAISQVDYNEAIAMQTSFSQGHNNLTFQNTINEVVRDREGNIRIGQLGSLNRDQIDAMDYYLQYVNPIGLYQEPVQTCGAGHSYTYTPSTNTLTCTACEAGTFADTALPNNCRQCSENFYTDTTGQSACSPCANGTYADPGSTSCYTPVNVYIIVGSIAGGAAIFVCFVIVVILLVLHCSQYPRLRFAPSKGVCTFVSIDFEHQQLLEEEFEYELD